MKVLLLTSILILTGLKSQASGLVRVECESRHGSRISLRHFGFPNTIYGLKVAEGPSEELHEPHGPTSMVGHDLVAEDPTNGLRFYLFGLFSDTGGASYPTPRFEIHVPVFGGQYIVRDTGSCVIH